MTVTIPAQTKEAQTDELSIVESPPTTADAQLIIQLMQFSATSGANEGWQLLQAFETPPTLSQLRRKYPRESREYGQISAFLGSCEVIGTFVKNGILHRGLTHDTWWIAGAWKVSEKVCKGMRKEAGEPRLYENFEALARTAP